MSTLNIPSTATAPAYRPLAALLFVGAYTILAAGNGVAAGSLLQQIDIAAFTFISFVCAVLMFALLRRLTPGAQAPLAGTLAGRDIATLNVTTAGSWILMYVAYANMEPAVASTLMCSVGPFIAVAVEKRGEQRDRGLRTCMALGFLFGSALLAYGSLSGHSALPDFDTRRIALAIMASFGCGYFMTVSTVYLKRLSTRGFSTGQVMAHRFYLMLLATGGYALWQGTLVPTAMAHGTVIVLLSVVGVVLPLILLQRGIALGSPFLTLVVIAFAPLFSMALQLFDGRLSTSALSVAGGAITCLFSVATVRVILRPV